MANNVFWHRMSILRLVRDGFHEGQGVAPDHDALMWLWDRYCEHFGDDLPAPYIYPTLEPVGGVMLEWTFGPLEVSLEIDLAEKAGEWDVTDVKTRTKTGDADEDDQVDLTDAESWQEIAAKIRKFFEEAFREP